jgi:LCP family protein required for cell wall assembly
MTEEGKTIDGFSVRRAGDSRLVSRSKANKIPSNKTTKKVRVVSQNDPLVKRKRARTSGVSLDTKPVKRRKVPKTNTAEMFTAKPKAFSITVESPQDEGDYLEDFANDARVDRTDKDFSEVTADAKASEDFLAPVESFDIASDNNSTDDGEILDVDDEEVKDMKKQKKELKESEKRAKREQKHLAKLEKKKKKSRVRKVLKWILIIFLLLIVGAGVYLYFWGDDIIKKITSGNGDVWSAISAFTKETYDPLKTDENGRTNVLVFGTSGFDSEGTGFGGYEHDGSNLTDSIMVVSLDQETGDVAIVSLPRDLYAGYTCTATSKINEVYWCNNQYGDNEAAGAEALQAKIKEVLGIDTQYWLHMNWGALVNIVDTLGGITITLDEDVNDQWYTGAVYSAGVPYTINGFDALGLSRARHGTEYGDFSRAASQQKILIGIKNRVVEKGLGLSDALNIISAVGDNLRMDFNMSEIKTGMHLLETFDLDNIRQIPIWDDNTHYMTFGNKDGISYVIPTAGFGVYGPLQDYVSQQLKSNPAEREGAVIIVYNGSGEDGVASQERELLEEKGYKVKEIANAPEGEYKFTEDIELYDASEGLKPDTKKALEKFYGVEAKDMSLLPNGISPVGYDFIIIVGGVVDEE